MISYLKGKVVFKGEDFIILDVGGVGFKVFLAEKVLEEIPGTGKTVELFTILYLRKETIELYGVLSSEELRVFEVLDKISGIGPKTALSLTSLGSLEELKRAIEARDRNFFGKVKGIGRKKMQMIILELTGKIKELNPKGTSQGDEVLETLIALGFSRKTAKEALAKIPRNIKEPEGKIKAALRLLGKQR